jgi:hypothetical protein
MPQLEALSAKDLGLFINNQDFVAVQDLTEESRQEITWRGAFGHDGPVLRTIRAADEDTLNFSAVVLKAGATRGLNKKSQLKLMRDFEVKVKQGEEILTFTHCNWTRISTRSSLTEVMLDCDISIPGFSDAFEQ